MDDHDGRDDAAGHGTRRLAVRADGPRSPGAAHDRVHRRLRTGLGRRRAAAYALAVGAAHVATAHPTAGTVAAAAVFAVNGVYQLTALKDFCLTKCRSPIGLLLRYASYRGPSRHLRAGAHHGAFCLGCCWSLMLLLTAFGVMNLWAMVGLAALVTAEKRLPRGRLVARVVGLTSLALAIAVFWVPLLAPGLTGSGMTEMGLRHP